MKLEQLKTFEDACKVEGLDPEKVIPDFSAYPEKHRGAMIAVAQLFIIVAAANRLANDGQEWTPDWNNNTWKYTAWFWLAGGSSGFRFDGHVSWLANSGVGSRLCFKSREVCEYVAKQFIDIYKQLMTI